MFGRLREVAQGKEEQSRASSKYYGVDSWRKKMLQEERVRYSWVKGSAKLPPTGPLRTAWTRLDEAWRPILNQADLPKESMQEWMQEYERYITKVSTNMKKHFDVTGQNLRAAAAKAASYTACGQDVWRRDELMALPDEAFEDLARTYNAIRQQAEEGKEQVLWHESLLEVHITFIPEDEDVDLIADPLRWRPISVTSLVLRTWVKVLARKLDAPL